MSRKQVRFCKPYVCSASRFSRVACWKAQDGLQPTLLASREMTNKMKVFLWEKATEEIVRSRYHMDSWRLTKAPRHIAVQQEHSYLCWLLIDGCHWQRWMVGGGGRGEANSAYACNTLHSLTIKHVTIFRVSIYKILGPSISNFSSEK